MDHDGLWKRLRAPPVVRALLILAGIRFVAPTLSAYLGIQGFDTGGLDAAFEAFTALLLVLLLLVVMALVLTWIGAARKPLAVVWLCAALIAVAQWIVLVLPPEWGVGRPMGPWTDFLLGITAAAALATFVAILSERVRRSGEFRAGGSAFLLFGLGFTAAYLMKSIRLLDYAYLFGVALPSGVTWLLDFGPSLLLAALPCLVWMTRLPFVSGHARPWFVDWLAPVGGAALAFFAALGLGGFLLANALAWGGAYVVFSPTTASLPIVGFGIGAFLSVAWSQRSRMPPDAWRLAFEGPLIAALSGIQTSSGTLVSLVGISVGCALAAAGLTPSLTPERARS